MENKASKPQVSPAFGKAMANSSMLPPIVIEKTKLTQAIIANQVALNFNENLKHTRYYKQKLKATCNAAQAELIKREAEFDTLYYGETVTTQEVCAAVEEMVTVIAGLGLYHFGAITELAKAYKKDPKSLQGIVNKINR